MLFRSDSAGRLVVDRQLNAEIHDAGRQIIGQAGARPKAGEVLADQITIGSESYSLQDHIAGQISAGGKTFRFADGFPGVEGKVHTMLAADGKLFVVTTEGSMYCFGGEEVQPARHAHPPQLLDRPDDRWTGAAARILGRTGAEAGYAIVLGMGTGRLAEELVRQSDLHVIVIEPDAHQADAFRRRLDRAGLYGTRIAVHAAEPLQFTLPPYLANLIVAEDPDAAGLQAGPDRTSVV